MIHLEHTLAVDHVDWSRALDRQADDAAFGATPGEHTQHAIPAPSS